jgi:hypothetical protein
MLAQMFSSRSARPLALATAGALTAVGLFAAPAGAATPRTTTSPAKAASGWLAQQFKNHFDYAGSTFFDGGTTADAIFALSAAGVGKDKIDSAIAYFAKHVDDYTSLHDKSGKPGPYDGSVAKTAVAALVAGVDPTHFGGYNLLHALKHDQCTAPSAPKNSKDTTTPVCPAAGAARNIYSSVSESLAILAEARGANKYGSTFAPDGPALSYFLSLQCANGGFTVDTAGGSHCVGDPDATGYAMMALQAAGHQSTALDRAAQWLTKIRNADGSWTAQHVHNVDSTGLAAAALRAHGVATSRSAAWLASQQVKTGPTVGAGASRGALKYNGAFDAASSVKATADGILGMVGHGSLATLSDASAIAGTPVLALKPGTVQRKRVVAGRQQTVSAAGFAAHEAVAGVLRPGGRSVGSARTDRNGTVTLTFTVPRSATGTRSVLLTGARSGLHTETASFHIAAAPATVAGGGTTVPTLADTGRDSRHTVLEVATGLGLIVTGALALLVGRRRAE